MGVVHGFDDGCPLCAAARRAQADRWSPLCRTLQWLAVAEAIVLLTGCFEPAWRAVLFGAASLGMLGLGRFALADLRRVRSRRRSPAAPA